MADHPIAEGLHLLVDVLEREKGQGRKFLNLTSESTRALENLPAQLMEATLAALVEARPTAVAEPAVSPSGGSVLEGPPAKLVKPSAAPGDRSEASVRAQLNQIFKDLKQCEKCRALGTLRESVVFAAGNPMADLMFVGEAPDAEEEKQRKPFVGPAGQKLNQILGAMGLSRDDIYISNIVKFRPKKGDGRFQGNSNRKPDPTEIEVSLPYIRREIEAVAPNVIVALGATAVEGLLQRGGAMSKLRGQTYDLHGVPVVVTYHPSLVIRLEGEGDAEKASQTKRLVWEDMLRAMELAELPISDKQRTYFQKG